jgi:hypothetical protein
MTEKLYKTDLNNEEWKIISSLIPQAKKGGRCYWNIYEE